MIQLGRHPRAIAPTNQGAFIWQSAADFPQSSAGKTRKTLFST
jgi:hypothetical protein